MESPVPESGEHKPDLADIEHELIHHAVLPRTAISDAIDAFVDFVGMIFSWLWVAVVAVIIYGVTARYGFSQGSVMLEELQWHLAGAAWLVGLGYTLVHDDHVRVDILHERFSERTKAWVELFGILFLLMPFLVITFSELLPYVISSFEQGERSQAPDGLPARWFLKAFMPISILLLGLAAFARLLKVTSRLFGFPPAKSAEN